ncbi:MAG: Hpt domain-containing protein [Thiothrix sp.]
MRISALDALADDLGVDGAIHLLERIVPLIKQRQDQLQAALQNGDSTAASQHAHKMIGSVRTYGSAKLEAVLARIRATGEESNANIADLQREFTAEFDAVAQGIQQWLDQHRLCADRA